MNNEIIPMLDEFFKPDYKIGHVFNNNSVCGTITNIFIPIARNERAEVLYELKVGIGLWTYEAESNLKRYDNP